MKRIGMSNYKIYQMEFEKHLDALHICLLMDSCHKYILLCNWYYFGYVRTTAKPVRSQFPNNTVASVLMYFG